MSRNGRSPAPYAPSELGPPYQSGNLLPQSIHQSINLIYTAGRSGPRPIRSQLFSSKCMHTRVVRAISRLPSPTIVVALQLNMGNEYWTPMLIDDHGDDA